MKGLSPRRWRLSPSMVVALLALFLALGGVGLAATQLARNSVGTAQLKDGAVTFSKIGPGAVGTTRIAQAAVTAFQVDGGTVQHRVTGSCRQTTAVGWVTRVGGVGCNITLPRESGTAGAQVPIGATSTPVLRKTLAPGTGYLVFANPSAIVTGTVVGQQVEVACTLSVGPLTQGRSMKVEIGPNHQQVEGLIPLIVADQALARPGTTASVSCRQSASAGAAPKVGVFSAISALQTYGSG
jgi:hypothetical protein